MSRITRITYLDPKDDIRSTERKWPTLRASQGDEYPSYNIEDVGVSWTEHTETTDTVTLVPWHRVLAIVTRRVLTAEERRKRADVELRDAQPQDHTHPNAWSERGGNGGTTTHAHRMTPDQLDDQGGHAHLDAGLNRTE